MTHRHQHALRVPKPITLELERDFQQLSRYSAHPNELQMDVMHSAPEKPRSGHMVYADGTDWDPGSGEGLYRYSIAGAWVFIG